MRRGIPSRFSVGRLIFNQADSLWAEADIF
jgi:hypothetical protein